MAIFHAYWLACSAMGLMLESCVVLELCNTQMHNRISLTEAEYK